MTSEQLPAISPGATAIGERDGALVSAGTIDALGEQLVAPCGEVGDVLVMCGTTLLPFVLTDQWIEVDGLWTFPSARAGIMAVGGASNAGGLFIDRVRALVGDTPPEELLLLGSDDLPVWLPYPRGERTPLHDPERRAELLDLHVGHTPAHVLMAAYEAAGFVVRHHIDLSGLRADRIVAVGGGTKSAAWMQALADTTGLAVDVAAEPYSAASGRGLPQQGHGRVSRPTRQMLGDGVGSRTGWSPAPNTPPPPRTATDASGSRQPTDEGHPSMYVRLQCCRASRGSIDRRCAVFEVLADCDVPRWWAWHARVARAAKHRQAAQGVPAVPQVRCARRSGRAAGRYGRSSPPGREVVEQGVCASGPMLKLKGVVENNGHRLAHIEGFLAVDACRWMSRRPRPRRARPTLRLRLSVLDMPAVTDDELNC